MVSYISIIVAAIVSIVIGFLWYGPLFGKSWMKMMNFSKSDMNKAKQKGMAKSYIILIISTLVMIYVLAMFLEVLSIATFGAGLMTAFWLWLGFVATITLSSVLWEGKSWNLWILNNAYNLINLLVASAILVAFI